MTKKYSVISRCVCAKLLLKKTVGIAYSECVFVTLVDQNAKRMRHIILSSAACPALQHSSVLTHKRHYFRGGGGATEPKMCVLNFSTTFVSNTFHSKKN
jgi:hypothetical protein